MRTTLPTELKDSLRAVTSLPIQYIGYVSKTNKGGRRQFRIIIVTTDHLFNCLPTGEIRRWITLNDIERVEACPSERGVYIHVSSEYNLLFQTPEWHFLVSSMMAMNPSIHYSEVQKLNVDQKKLVKPAGFVQGDIVSVQEEKTITIHRQPQKTMVPSDNAMEMELMKKNSLKDMRLISFSKLDAASPREREDVPRFEASKNSLRNEYSGSVAEGTASPEYSYAVSPPAAAGANDYVCSRCKNKDKKGHDYLSNADTNEAINMYQITLSEERAQHRAVVEGMMAELKELKSALVAADQRNHEQQKQLKIRESELQWLRDRFLAQESEHTRIWTPGFDITLTGSRLTRSRLEL